MYFKSCLITKKKNVSVTKIPSETTKRNILVCISQEEAAKLKVTNEA